MVLFLNILCGHRPRRRAIQQPVTVSIDLEARGLLHAPLSRGMTNGGS
jgi:hypothetical protein